MDAAAFLQRLSDDDVTRDRLVHIETPPARAPETAPFPGLPDPIPDRLLLLGVEGLYPHQGPARAALEDPKSTALFLFPTKALARDQVRQIRSLRLPQIRAAVYDGDTPGPERPLIRRTANLILTNPDMLHAGILPGHARWADFFLRLSLIVVDEAHVCRGVFGSHVALVLRRLRRLVAHYGGTPRFVMTSATVGNPAELAERLVGQPFEAVGEDRPPPGEKLFCLWKPPPLADATRRSLNPALAGRVKAYRAGYLPEERRALERALADGDLLAVASTSALELGIDIGSLAAAELVERRGRLHARAGDAPHTAVDIRSASGRLFLIVEDGTGALLGTVDEPRAFLQVHPGAIYLHQGEQYEVLELDLGRSVALVRPSDADWYTQSRDTTDIEVLRSLTESKLGET